MTPSQRTGPFVDTCKALCDPGDHELLTKLREGNETAAEQLYARYARRLIALAKARTGNDLSHRFDAEDVIQSVFRSFFERARKGYYDVPSGGDLWPLLLIIAIQKVRTYATYHTAKCRDIRREIGSECQEMLLSELPQIDSEQPGSLLNLIAEETLGQLPPLHQQVTRWRLEGYDHQEIAQKTGRSKRTIERIFQECRHILEEIFPERSHEYASSSS